MGSSPLQVWRGHAKVPKSVEFVESLPKGETGEILKKVLRAKNWADRERRVR